MEKCKALTGSAVKGLKAKLRWPDQGLQQYSSIMSFRTDAPAMVHVYALLMDSFIDFYEQ